MRTHNRASTGVSAIDDRVAGMGSERLRQPAGDVPHEVGRAPVEPIDPLREVQRFLYLPDLIVPVGWQNARRVANGHPSDRHHGAGSRRVRRWTVAWTLTSLPRPTMAPWKIAAPVATNTSSSSVAPVT